jgi:glutamine amidotransferase
MAEPGGKRPFVAVLDYGIGNLRSAEKALQRVGADARLITSASEASGAVGVVLPGVGAFGACMAALCQSGLDKIALEAVAAGTPFLGICVGMQLMYEGSDESPGVDGLGILEGRVVRIPEGVKHPQMQWNVLNPTDPSHPLFARLPTPMWVYFVHSFAPESTDDVLATCDYGGPVVAAAAKPNVWAMQFHPEKSSVTGLALLSNFVNYCRG